MTDPLRGAEVTYRMSSRDEVRKRAEANGLIHGAAYHIDPIGNAIVDARLWCPQQVRDKAIPRLPEGLCCGWRRHADRNIDPVIKRWYLTQCEKLHDLAGYRDMPKPKAKSKPNLQPTTQTESTTEPDTTTESEVSQQAVKEVTMAKATKKSTSRKTTANKKATTKKKAKATTKKSPAKKSTAKATSSSGTKQCERCEKRFGLDQFLNLSRRPDGKGRFCPGCRAERKAERAARKAKVPKTSRKTAKKPSAGKVVRRRAGGGKKVAKTPRRPVARK